MISKFPPTAQCAFDVEQLKQFDQIIVSPGIPLKTSELVELKKAGIKIVGDIELFVRSCTAPIVATTGSNAKSTVTTMLGLMAEKMGVNVAVGGNLDINYRPNWGQPALDLLQQNADLFILELSSFQLELTYSLQAEVATMLNFSSDHLDQHGSMSGYHQAKHRIFINAKKRVFNFDESLTEPLHSRHSKSSSFTLNTPDLNQWGLISSEGRHYLAKGLVKIIDCKDLKLQGSHHYSNALAALAVADSLHWDIEKCCTVLKQFAGLPHRAQLIDKRKGIDWIDDSKATNTASAIASIKTIAETIKGKLIVIVGGIHKHQNFSELVAVMNQYVNAVMVIGVDVEFFKDYFNKLSSDIKVIYCNTINNAVQQADKMAAEGDSVLLAPACSSQDQFENYRQRGEYFANCIEGLS